jgi:hypothetical protein
VLSFEYGVPIQTLLGRLFDINVAVVAGCASGARPRSACFHSTAGRWDRQRPIAHSGPVALPPAPAARGRSTTLCEIAYQPPTAPMPLQRLTAFQAMEYVFHYFFRSAADAKLPVPLSARRACAARARREIFIRSPTHAERETFHQPTIRKNSRKNARKRAVFLDVIHITDRDSNESTLRDGQTEHAALLFQSSTGEETC